MYSARQRDLRERRMRAARDEAHGLGDEVTAIEIEEGLDFEPPASFGIAQRRRATAA
jgi:hypothetical protein